MQDKIEVLDKTFVPYITHEEICEDIRKVAVRMRADLKDKNPLFICVLNGAFRFAGELFNHIDYKSEVTFVKVASYAGTSTTGKIHEMIGLTHRVEGRTIVIVEDIIDTGYTMRDILGKLESKLPEQIKVCTMLSKPDALRVEVPIHYVAREIPNDFIVGFGLDYNGYGRELNDIYTIVK